MKQNSEISIGAKGTEYGNWMSMPVIRMFSIITAVFALAFVLVAVLWGNPVCNIILAALTIIMVLFTAWLLRVRKAFSFTGGKVMDRIQQNLASYLNWDGKGTLLDVGCGSGALSIRCAKMFPEAKITGIDYWGPMWDYSRAVCEKNAQLEGVSAQCTFVQGDATKLDFADETFDAVVSNFVYHEVTAESDKKKLILESLRVLKKGGCFAIQDFFDREKMFGTPEEMTAFLKENGISEVHYEGKLDEKEWIPNYCISPIVIKDIGGFWGVK